MNLVKYVFDFLNIEYRHIRVSLKSKFVLFTKKMVKKKCAKLSSRLDKNCLTYAASRFEKHSFEKNTS